MKQKSKEQQIQNPEFIDEYLFMFNGKLYSTRQGFEGYYKDFKELKGKTIISYKKENDYILFFTSCGEVFIMYHDQECCENVYIESVVGDLDDLLDAVILSAEESKDHSNFPLEDYSCTWTFYKLRTQKGYIDIRWYGSSNGYYSESVSLLGILPIKQQNTDQNL